MQIQIKKLNFLQQNLKNMEISLVTLQFGKKF